MKLLGCLAVIAVGLAAAGIAYAESAPGLDAKLGEAKAALNAGNFDAAVVAARVVAHDARDNDTRADAMKLVADALRKKGDWAAAGKAYGELKARLDKATDGFIVADGTADVLQASTDGVYPGAAPVPTIDGKKPTLADDAYLLQSLEALGEARAEKLRARVATLKAAATPEAVLAQLKELMEAYHAARVLAPKLPPGGETEAAKAADARMESLSVEAQLKLRAKLADMQKEIGQRDALTNTQRQEAEDYSQMCQKLVTAEETFRDALKGLGNSRQPDVRDLAASSQKRTRDETALARQFQRIASRTNVGNAGRRW